MLKYLTHLGCARVTIGVGLVLLVGPEPSLGGSVLIANASSHLLVQILKRLVARPRPADANGNPTALVELPDQFSFPSGHSAASFAVALPIAAAHPFTAPTVVTLAIIVAVSRVKLRVHYASDVAGGVALGMLGAWLGIAVV
jgi:undecaprenyl-diphosphatase